MDTPRKEKMTFEEIVKDEIINTMINHYDYSELKAIKFAKRYHNRIESDMWTVFDNEIAEIMSKKLSKKEEK